MADNKKSKFRERMNKKRLKLILEEVEDKKKKDNIIRLKDNQEEDKILEKYTQDELINSDIKKEEEKELEKIILKHKIVKKIEKNLNEKKNELDIIDSQIYIINKLEDESKTIDEIKEQQEKILELKKKIEKIKEQLKIYTKNEVINKAIQLDEKSLIEDILTYKRMLETEVELKKEYETIKSYIYLTEEIEKVNDRCIELDNKKEKELTRLNISEDEFKELELKLVKEDEITELINQLVEEQEKEIMSIESDVETIEKKYETIYNYDLCKKLFSLELKYLALLSLSPLSNTIPSIAIAAATTKDMIDLLTSKNLVRTEEKITYYARDYSNHIENISYKINNMEKMLSESLYSIGDIKEKFLNNNDLINNPKYEDFILKIEKLEDMLKENISKVEIHKVKLNKNKNKNNKKMEKILELNKK